MKSIIAALMTLVSMVPEETEEEKELRKIRRAKEVYRTIKKYMLQYSIISAGYHSGIPLAQLALANRVKESWKINKDLSFDDFYKGGLK